MQHEPGAGRQLPIAKAALATISKGGYPEALGRVLALLARHDVPLRLEQLELMQELAQDFAHLLPHLARDQERRTRGEQDIIVFYEPARALETLPLLLTNPADRARLRKFLDRLLADPRLADFKPTPQQRALLKRIRKIVAQPASWRRASTRSSTNRKRAAAQRRRKTISTVPPLLHAAVEGIMRN